MHSGAFVEGKKNVITLDAEINRFLTPYANYLICLKFHVFLNLKCSWFKIAPVIIESQINF